MMIDDEYVPDSEMIISLEQIAIALEKINCSLCRMERILSSLEGEDI